MNANALGKSSNTKRRKRPPPRSSWRSQPGGTCRGTWVMRASPLDSGTTGQCHALDPPAPAAQMQPARIPLIPARVQRRAGIGLGAEGAAVGRARSSGEGLGDANRVSAREAEAIREASRETRGQSQVQSSWRAIHSRGGITGGGGEIRTHGGREPSPVFKTGALNRSATPPSRGIL